MTHTPGPWTYTTWERGDELAIVATNPHQWIADVVIDHDNGDKSAAEQAANARLIAAAPELLEALKAITDCWGLGYDLDDKFCEQVADFMAEGRAAIAKATHE